MPETNTTARLEKCFSSVFPDIRAEQIGSLQADHVAQWDSMATVTLMAVVNEEFGLDLDLDQLEPLTSFEAFRQFLETKQLNHG